MAGLTRVFVSFDYDHDLDLKTMLVGQSKNLDSPFAIADWSIKEPSSDWKEKARRRIRGCGAVAVICGLHTASATGVSAELGIAKSESVPYFLLQGRSSGRCTKPASATPSDITYNWTWPNLKLLIGGSR